MEYIKSIREKIGNEEILLNCVGAAILNDKKQVLLQKRADKNLWGFPGGIMELHESFSEAIKREVEEETGLEIDIKRLIGIYSKYYDEYPNGDKVQPILVFFECVPMSKYLRIDNNETLELKYFGINEMPKLVNQQHIDMFDDLFSFGKTCAIR